MLGLRLRGAHLGAAELSDLSEPRSVHGRRLRALLRVRHHDARRCRGEGCTTAAADLALVFGGAPEDQMVLQLEQVRSNLEAGLAQTDARVRHQGGPVRSAQPPQRSQLP